MTFVEELYQFWYVDTRARQRSQTATILLSFAYGVINSLVLGRSERQVTLETVGLVCFLTITFPILYCLKPHTNKFRIVSLGDIFQNRIVFGLAVASAIIILSLPIANRIPAVKTGILSWRVVQAAHNPTDATSIVQAREVLETAQKNSVQLPSDVVERTGKSFIQAASQQPAAWDVALQYVQYRSYLNLTLPLQSFQPAPGTPAVITTQYKTVNPSGYPPAQFSVVGVISKDKAARFNMIGEDLTSDAAYGNQWIIATGGGIVMDGFKLKNVVLAGVHVVYMGGPLQMENVYFVDCTFDLARGMHGQEVASAILSSVPVSAEISGNQQPSRPKATS
jgi:hypothetical protein